MGAQPMLLEKSNAWCPRFTAMMMSAFFVQRKGLGPGLAAAT